MEREIGCSICGIIGIQKDHDKKFIVNGLVRSGITEWLFCDDCALIVHNFADNLQALRPNKDIDDWPTPEDIEQAGKSTAIERREALENKKVEPNFMHFINKSEIEGFVRKADFDDLELRFWKMHGDYRELRKKVESIDRLQGISRIGKK